MLFTGWLEGHPACKNATLAIYKGFLADFGRRRFRIDSKICCEGALPFCGALSRRGLNSQDHRHVELLSKPRWLVKYQDFARPPDNYCKPGKWSSKRLWMCQLNDMIFKLHQCKFCASWLLENHDADRQNIHSHQISHNHGSGCHGYADHSSYGCLCVVLTARECDCRFVSAQMTAMTGMNWPCYLSTFLIIPITSAASLRPNFLCSHVWRGSVTVRALNLRSTGHGFDFRLFHFHVMTLGKLFTHICLCH